MAVKKVKVMIDPTIASMLDDIAEDCNKNYKTKISRTWLVDDALRRYFSYLTGKKNSDEIRKSIQDTLVEKENKYMDVLE